MGGSVRFLPAANEWTHYRVELLEESEYYYFAFRSVNAPTQLLRRKLTHSESVERLFISLWRTWTMRQDGYYHRALSIACGHLEQDELTVTEIAELLGYAGAHYFSRLFHQEMGCTAEEYRRRMRRRREETSVKFQNENEKRGSQ